MPYIKNHNRQAVDIEIDNIINKVKKEFDVSLDGVLNYVISRIVSESFGDCSPNEWSYKDIARAVAVFECAKLEFYRRIAAPKEDVAISTNGDIPAYES